MLTGYLTDWCSFMPIIVNVSLNARFLLRGCSSIKSFLWYIKWRQTWVFAAFIVLQLGESTWTQKSSVDLEFSFIPSCVHVWITETLRTWVKRKRKNNCGAHRPGNKSIKILSHWGDNSQANLKCNAIYLPLCIWMYLREWKWREDPFTRILLGRGISV